MPTEPSMLGASCRELAGSEYMQVSTTPGRTASSQGGAKRSMGADLPTLPSGSKPTWLFIARALVALTAIGVVANAQQQDAGPKTEGERLFDSHCSACHQYDDQGMGEAPPLENAPWVVGPSKRLVLILLHGISGRIELGGRVYDREMPGFGRTLSDHEVAALATYTRRRFGAAEPNVTAAEVKRIRDEHADRTAYWPASELLRLN